MRVYLHCPAWPFTGYGEVDRGFKQFLPELGVELTDAPAPDDIQVSWNLMFCRSISMQFMLEISVPISNLSRSVHENSEDYSNVSPFSLLSIFKL